MRQVNIKYIGYTPPPPTKNLPQKDANAKKGKCVVAIDDSGSTTDCVRYWQYVEDLIFKYSQEYATPEFILWDNNARSVSPSDALHRARHCKGWGGTSPISILRHLSLHTDMFVMVSDGQIVSEEVLRLDDEIRARNLSFGFVEVHLVSDTPLNLSVCCPLTRGAHQIFMKEREIPAQNVRSFSQEEATLIHGIISGVKTTADFLHKEESIRKWVEMLSMGSRTTNIDALNAVKDMQSRIRFHESRSKEALGTELYQLLRQDDLHEAEELAKIIATGDETDHHRRIDQMKSYLENGLHDYELVREVAQSRKENCVVPNEPLPEVEEDDSCSNWECPVALDTDTPLVLISTGQSIFSEITDPTTVQLLRENPLCAFKYPDVQNAILKRLRPPLGLAAFSVLVDRRDLTHPLTREHVRKEAICLGVHSSHAKATDSALSILLNNGVKCGNLDLWFAVIAYMIVKLEDSHYLGVLKDMCMNHLRYRLEHRMSFASLSGLGPCLTRMPLGAAVWWCYGAAACEVSGRETVRKYLWNPEPFEWLIEDVQGFRVSDMCKRHIERLRVLSCFKRDQSVRQRIRGLYQATTDSGVFLDGPADEAMQSRVRSTLPTFMRNFGVDELVGLSLVEKDVPLSPYWVPPERLPEAVVTFPCYWGKPLNDERLKICEKTCRPYYKPDWIEEATEKHGMSPHPEKRLSVTARFMVYTSKFKKYPSDQELLQYLATKYDTLPRQTEAWIRRIANYDFGEIRRDLSPQEASRRFNESVNINVRRQMESIQFYSAT